MNWDPMDELVKEVASYVINASSALLAPTCQASHFLLPLPPYRVAQHSVDGLICITAVPVALVPAYSFLPILS